MTIRKIRPDDLPSVRAMMRELWSEAGNYDFSDETTFVWEREEGGLGGFISLSVRPWAEGCDAAPVPYIEGWWVASDLRRQGVGRRLVETVQQWRRDRGHAELGSDVDVTNEASLDAHVALGFEPTMKLQFFRKRLSRSHGDE